MHSFLWAIFLLLVCSSNLAVWTQGLHITHIQVPRFLVVGQKAVLKCHFVLDGDSLYSLKWWKDDKQFYQYIPANEDSVVVHSLKGATVRKSESNPYAVELLDVQSSASGQYRCEVVAESPPFHTHIMAAILTIIDAPDGSPKIKGLSPFYHVADVININCSSIRSRPAATLHWTVNRNRVMEDSVIVYPIVSEGQDDYPLYTTTVGLRLPAQRSLFVHDFLHVKCTANIQGYEWISEGTARLSNDTYAQPHHLPTLTLTGRGSSSGSSLSRHTTRSLSSLLWEMNDVCLQMLLLVFMVTMVTVNPQCFLCIT